jgi:hypothetical protein
VVEELGGGEERAECEALGAHADAARLAQPKEVVEGGADAVAAGRGDDVAKREAREGDAALAMEPPERAAQVVAVLQRRHRRDRLLLCAKETLGVVVAQRVELGGERGRELGLAERVALGRARALRYRGRRLDGAVAKALEVRADPLLDREPLPAGLLVGGGRRRRRGGGGRRLGGLARRCRLVAPARPEARDVARRRRGGCSGRGGGGEHVAQAQRHAERGRLLVRERGDGGARLKPVGPAARRDRRLLLAVLTPERGAGGADGVFK